MLFQVQIRDLKIKTRTGQFREIQDQLWPGPFSSLPLKFLENVGPNQHQKKMESRTGRDLDQKKIEFRTGPGKAKIVKSRTGQGPQNFKISDQFITIHLPRWLWPWRSDDLCFCSIVYSCTKCRDVRLFSSFHFRLRYNLEVMRLKNFAKISKFFTYSGWLWFDRC